MIGKRQSFRLCVLTAGLLGLFVCSAARAATVTVNSLADPGAPGICTLRDAITAANTMTATNGCAAGSGNDTIKFSPRMTGTISLVSTLPEVTDSLLTINVPASGGITISGGAKVPVMGIAANATVNINSLTIADGNSNTNGGVIANFGILNLNRLTIADGRTDFNGGGIANSGILTVTNSSFSGNTAFGAGGGILNLGPLAMLTVVNSTFSGNAAGSFAGGGGIYSGGLSLTVLNCTFDRNSASGGGGIFKSNLLAIGTATVTNSTFSGNTAGIDGGGGVNDLAGDFTLKNTIFAANSGGNCIGGITDAGYNISDDSTCGFAKTGSANNGDGVNPLLSAAGLANNGGPTQTIALQLGSPAIDAIPLADCTDQASPPNLITDDQRGFPRPDAGERVCDIGAYESTYR